MKILKTVMFAVVLLLVPAYARGKRKSVGGKAFEAKVKQREMMRTEQNSTT